MPTTHCLPPEFPAGLDLFIVFTDGTEIHTQTTGRKSGIPGFATTHSLHPKTFDYGGSSWETGDLVIPLDRREFYLTVYAGKESRVPQRREIAEMWVDGRHAISQYPVTIEEREGESGREFRIISLRRTLVGDWTPIDQIAFSGGKPEYYGISLGGAPPILLQKVSDTRAIPERSSEELPLAVRVRVLPIGAIVNVKTEAKTVRGQIVDGSTDADEIYLSVVVGGFPRILSLVIDIEVVRLSYKAEDLETVMEIQLIELPPEMEVQ